VGTGVLNEVVVGNIGGIVAVGFGFGVGVAAGVERPE
jgi:hypothetical protein